MSPQEKHFVIVLGAVRERGERVDLRKRETEVDRQRGRGRHNHRLEADRQACRDRGRKRWKGGERRPETLMDSPSNTQGETPPKPRNLFIETHVCILTCLNFSHLQSTLHLRQYTD